MKKMQKRSLKSPSAGTRYHDNPLVQAFAVRLREWRLEKGLKLKAVAAKTDVSVSIVCEWEHGSRFPSVDHLWAVSKLTGIPAHDLLLPVKGAGKRKSRAR